MSIPKVKLLAALERRYDYLSARSVLSNVLTASGLQSKDQFTEAEVKNVAASLPKFGEMLDPVIDALQVLTGGAPAPAKEEPKAAPPKAEVKKEEPKPEPPKPEPPKPEPPKAEVKKEEPKPEPPKAEVKKEEPKKEEPKKAKGKGKKK